MYELFKDDVLPWHGWIYSCTCMILYMYAVLAYVSTPYMTGEHGINWMMMIVRVLCIYIFMDLYGKYFCCICCDSVNFHHFLVLAVMYIHVFMCVTITHWFWFIFCVSRIFSCDFLMVPDPLRRKGIKARRLTHRPNIKEENQYSCLPKKNTRELSYLLL